MTIIERSLHEFKRPFRFFNGKQEESKKDNKSFDNYTQIKL